MADTRWVPRTMRPKVWPPHYRNTALGRDDGGTDADGTAQRGPTSHERRWGDVDELGTHHLTAWGEVRAPSATAGYSRTSGALRHQLVWGPAAARSSPVVWRSNRTPVATMPDRTVADEPRLPSDLSRDGTRDCVARGDGRGGHVHQGSRGRALAGCRRHLRSGSRVPRPGTPAV